MTAPPVPEGAVGRIGLFGGTFDPPHAGHVSVAADVADALALDRVVWMPAGIPPHKRSLDTTDPRVRMRMAEAAAKVDARFVVSDLELRRHGPSYTVDTVRALDAAQPDDDLFVIVGADQYRSLDSWRNPGGILDLACLAVMDRDGAVARDTHPEIVRDRERTADIGASATSRVVFVPVRRVDVSSTDIRDRVLRGEDVSGMVPPAVLDIVDEEGLYRS